MAAGPCQAVREGVLAFEVHRTAGGPFPAPSLTLRPSREGDLVPTPGRKSRNGLPPRRTAEQNACARRHDAREPGGRMNEWAVLIVGAVLAAVLGLAVPRAWVMVKKKRKGPLVSSVSISDFRSFAPALLVPGGGARPEDALGEPDSRERSEWLHQVGMPLGWQSVQLILRGQSPSPVVITSITPIVLSSGPPLGGWFIAPELGAAQEIRTFVVDLDAPRPRALLMDSKPTGTHLKESYSFRVSDTEVEQFEVNAFTTMGSYAWGLDISYDDEGKLGVLRIRDERLRVTAQVQDRQAALFQQRDGAWVPADWGNGFAEQTADSWRSIPRAR